MCACNHGDRVALTVLAEETIARARAEAAFLHTDATQVAAGRVRLSIIAVHYRQNKLLKRMLRSLCGREPFFEVIVVNVAPRVEPAIPPDFDFPLKILTVANRGYADACNKGLSVARGEAIALCNADIELAPGVLSSAMRYFDAHDDVGLIAPRLLNADGSPQHSARRFYTWPVALWARCPLRNLLRAPGFFRRHFLEDETGPGLREIDWAVGAVLFVRRAALADQGRAMDSRYHLYMEDVDLCLGMWHGGWKVVQALDMRVYHRYQRRSRRLLSLAACHHVASFLKFVLKHRGLPERIE